MMEYHLIQCCCIISLSFSEKEEFGMSVSIHSTLIPDTEWVLNDEKTVKWEWNEEEEISKGLTLVRNFPSKLPSVLHLNSVQSDNFLIPCRRDLILFTFSHQKWRNDPGMVDQNIKFDKNIKFDWNFQKLTKMSTVDKNVKFDKNIKFDQNINLTKMSNLGCTFSKIYLPLPHLLTFDYLGDSSVLDRKEIFPSLILFCVSWNLVIGHQGQGGTDETNVFTVLVLRFSAQITSMHFCRIFHYQK